MWTVEEDAMGFVAVCTVRTCRLVFRCVSETAANQACETMLDCTGEWAVEVPGAEVVKETDDVDG